MSPAGVGERTLVRVTQAGTRNYFRIPAAIGRMRSAAPPFRGSRKEPTMPTSDLAMAGNARRARTTGARAVLVLLGLYVLGHSLPARAEEIGAKHNLVISAERLFGVYIDNQSVDRGAAPNAVDDHTVFGLGWGPAPSTLTIPRVGIDYFLTEALTLGGNFGFFSHNIDNGGNQSTTITAVLFGARVGYALRLGHAVSFWPRAGLTYTTVSGGDTHVLALTIDAPFTFSPSEGFAILVGPVLELGLIGKERGANYSEVLFGLMVGLAGWTGL
jgi:hypothetical protein